MTTQELLQWKETSTDTELDRLVSSMFLLTLDPKRALSVATEDEESGNAILSIDLNSRFAFILHHVLGYNLEDAASFARMSEDEFRLLLRSAYFQLATLCEFQSAGFFAEPALA